MAILVNRNPTGRLICLHALTQTLNEKFNQNKFSINDIKYDADSKTNITNFCDLLIKKSSTRTKVCPYLDNPISEAKCYLTQSIQLDTQKSKSASDAVNALDGLGFINRGEKDSVLTDTGRKFARCNFDSEEWLEIVRKAVLGYGPFIGLLHNIQTKKMNDSDKVSKPKISLGFPDTAEQIRSDEGKLIELSTGSKQDTITRTRSLLFAWATTAGFVMPSNYKKPDNVSKWHIGMKEFVERKKWHASNYDFFIPPNLFDGSFKVERPLHYSRLTKSIRSLRERGQQVTRDMSSKYDCIIKNRRFAIVYCLGKFAEVDRSMNFRKFVTLLLEHPNDFIIDENRFSEVMEKERGIAEITGIPFTVNNDNLKPLTRINLEVLQKDAPQGLISTLEEIMEKME